LKQLFENRDNGPLARQELCIFMDDVIVVNRRTKKKEKEKIMGHLFIHALYSPSLFSRFLAPILYPVFCRFHGFSYLYGVYQRLPLSRMHIVPFIKKFKVDSKEFTSPVQAFKNFNDFFTRKLKPKARPIDSHIHTAICPADGRYLCFQKMDQIHEFWIKGRAFSLTSFLKDPKLAAFYKEGSLVIARLCPSDYHRFHFPITGLTKKPKLINGALFSVNPIALIKNFLILQENKRMVTVMDSDQFGRVTMVEIGATNVGSIHQTFKTGQPIHKGNEKGYFSFGGSCIVLLFEKGRIELDEDLCQNTLRGFETLALMGQSLGKKS